ncbi:MAG: glucose 1-dehydrogenase [Pseudomonadales bacterium]|jgi:NAD(P)-dependent dehydrogenase (short-subunit alcohol dehydrogenase family)
MTNEQREGRLRGRIALVTGAASGIGRGAALALAAEGARLIVTDIDETGLAETLAMLRAAGGEAVSFHHDVTDEARWQAILETVRATFGGLHVLVNNAGIGIMTSIFTMSHADWSRQQAINVDGVFFGLKHGCPLIGTSGGGSVINISSLAGLRGSPGLAGYCATKGAVRLLSKAVALECAQAGMNVRVNSVHPGIIDTAIWTKVSPQQSSALGLTVGANGVDAQALGAGSPLGYAGLPADIAAGIVYLASEESRYVTGSELVIDGGMSAK